MPYSKRQSLTASPSGLTVAANVAEVSVSEDATSVSSAGGPRAHTVRARATSQQPLAQPSRLCAATDRAIAHNPYPTLGRVRAEDLLHLNCWTNVVIGNRRAKPPRRDRGPSPYTARRPARALPSVTSSA